MILANDPLFTREALTEHIEKPKENYNKKNMKSYVIQTIELHTRNKDSMVGRQNECIICGGKYDFDDCNVFNN